MPNAEAEVPPQQGDKKKKPEPFHLAEKIGLTMSFPRKDRELADELRRSMLAILRYSVEIDRRYFKKTTTQNMDVELAVLRKFVRLAASKDLHGGKYPPPLTMHQYETWAKFNDEIGRLLGGYIASL